jgi:DNA-binding HxlR family transcriptional regulator
VLGRSAIGLRSSGDVPAALFPLGPRALFPMVVLMVVGTRTAVSRAIEADRAETDGRPACCSMYHRAVELIGKRWTGAILMVLMDGPLRFSQIKHLVPDLSDRLLSERLKELEGEGIVARYEEGAACSRAQYGLTAKGRALEPAVRALKTWANTHL